MPVPPPDPRPMPAARAVLGVCLLAVVVLGLHLLVPPALAAPDPGAPASWLDWATSRSPVLVAMALVRVLALGLAWYLLVVTALQVVAVVTDAGWLATLARSITPTTARHLATAVVGAGVMAATPVASVHGAAFAQAPAGTMARPSVVAVPGVGDLPSTTDSPPRLRRVPSQRPTTVESPSPSTTPPRLRRASPSAGPVTAPSATTSPAATATPDPTPSTTATAPTQGPTTVPSSPGAPEPTSSPANEARQGPDLPTTGPHDPTTDRPADAPRLSRLPSTTSGDTPTSSDQDTTEATTVPDQRATRETGRSSAVQGAGQHDGTHPPDATEAARDPDLGRTDQADASPPRTTWTVVAGDHFWGVAEREVARHLGRAPTEDEVAAWWRRLVEVNRDRLVDPDNPDLILPGQVMRFPSPASGAG